MSETLIVIPARYGSTRFPGKPLALIAGRSMISRTAANAAKAAKAMKDADYVVATDDVRIADHCREHHIPVLMTPGDVATGSDRARHAADAYAAETGTAPEFIINLQGDAPFTPTEHILAVRHGLETGCDVATPYVRLSWEALDRLREHKKDTPFSGTSVIVDRADRAVWFSKNIIPAIRKEKDHRAAGPLSPVRRHVGLYGYKAAALKRYTTLPETDYEKLEGLEQLRLLENGFSVQCVSVQPPAVSIPGIDAPEDVALAERMIAEHGDPHG